MHAYLCIFFSILAENLVADGSSDIQMIAEHAKGEICYLKCVYQCLAYLELTVDIHGASCWIVSHFMYM